MLRLDHVVFPVADAARSLAFYRDTLGLPLVAAHSGDDWGGYSWLMLVFGLSDADELVLVALRGAPAPNYAGLPNDARHYALSAASAKDWEAWRSKLRAAGVGGWEEDHGDQRSLYFEDPDGVVLEITWPPSRPAREASADAEAHAAAWIAASA